MNSMRKVGEPGKSLDFALLPVVDGEAKVWFSLALSRRMPYLPFTISAMVISCTLMSRYGNCLLCALNVKLMAL